jgi:hypothetical protein
MMDFVRAIIAFAVVVGLALLLGKLDHHKHPEAFTYGWLGAIAVLLLLRWCL